jgi:glyoxylase-like metal-dependent hydrolase (beta-lactamase superfamily II)
MFDKKSLFSFAALASFPFGITSPMQGQADTASPGVSIQNPGTYAFSIGDAQITALSDGTVPQDLHALLRGTTKGQTDALLQRSFLANPVETSLNAFLLKMDGKVVLIDTGVGQLFGPGCGGKLVQSLSAAGVSPDQVTDVLLTHLHPDHMGGLVQDGHIVFTNATVHVAKADLDFVLDRSNAAKAHYDEKYFDQAFQTVKLYVDLGKVQSFSGTAEILPGVTGTVHPGHTPGSAFYTVQSKEQKIVFVGDIVHAAAVQFPEPSITIAYDVDLKRASKTRAESFALFARDRTLIAVPHLPFPGVGHIRAAGNAYEWVPVEYAYRASK